MRIFDGFEISGDELSLLEGVQLVDERAPALAHRQLAEIIASEFPAPAIMYNRFEDWNVRFFGQQLRQALILITNCALRANGDYCPADVNGIRSRIRIAPHLWAKGGGRLLLDVLLHEMVHAWCHEIEEDLELGYRGHGPKFAKKCNEIGAILGLPEVAPKGRGGKPNCAHWPIRPEGYYGPNWPSKTKTRKQREPTSTVDEKPDLNSRLLAVLADIAGVSRSQYLQELLLTQARAQRDECLARDPGLVGEL